jgi:hypothetical protein
VLPLLPLVPAATSYPQAPGIIIITIRALKFVVVFL